MRTIKASLAEAFDPLNLRAINRRYHAKIVAGLATQSHFCKLRPAKPLADFR